MKRLNLKAMSIVELVDRFVTLGLGQFQAQLRSEIAKNNRLIRQMWDVTDELKNRPGDQRSALLPLFDHPNVQVRLMAARLTLAVAPATARQALEDIENSKEYPQAMDAGMSLWALDEGIFTPT